MSFFISLKNLEGVRFLGHLWRKTKNTICNSLLSGSNPYVSML
jgi:hypothetical protein